MVILENPISREELCRLAENFYGDMIKGVVDVDQELLALDAELHSDLEGMLLREGSQQEALWGINLYPEADDEDFLEDSRLSDERWKNLSFIEQMANIGSEVGRTAKWVQKAKPSMAEGAFVRAFELIDLTLKYGRLNSPYRDTMLKELCKLREYFCGAYEISDTAFLTWLDKYFRDFALAQRRQTLS